ncbi:MAG: 1-deoxy-D-xylulose-5-phosphate reductoisomerase [Candidatus Dormibacteraeota bacterium]|nr:1-deoxy-D-xylulose-5-phosphate reductoisomerase [Candidatus Dormibacteraeota bacterium]
MNQRARIVLLGATGSIGRQACDVIERHPDRFQLVGAVVGRDADGLTRLVHRFGIKQSAVVDPMSDAELPAGCTAGADAAADVAAMDADVVCVAITGAAALRPALAAVDAGRLVAVATKEVLVMAGDLVRRRAAAGGSRIVPVDSEHSAIWQCLRGEAAESVSRIVLTASGGPFLHRDLHDFAGITAEQALNHPTWRMGPKVTTDSATMMNKGLEVVEAHFLFEVPYSKIGVVIHPTSLVHSYVEFVDGATKAQLGVPDMRVPIALALADGHRLPEVGPPLELTAVPSLEFIPLDDRRFPAVGVARRAGERGGVAPAVLNAANEVAVQSFLGGSCRFDQIVPAVAAVVDEAPELPQPSLDDILAADAWARAAAADRLGRVVPV